MISSFRGGGETERCWHRLLDGPQAMGGRCRCWWWSIWNRMLLCNEWRSRSDEWTCFHECLRQVIWLSDRVLVNCFFFKHNFCVKPYVPREPRRDPSNRRLNEHGIYIRHCQESNSQPVPSQAGVDTTRPQWQGCWWCDIQLVTAVQVDDDETKGLIVRTDWRYLARKYRMLNNWKTGRSIINKLQF